MFGRIHRRETICGLVKKISLRFYKLSIWNYHTLLLIVIELTLFEGPKEIKVLVDLALISAIGKGDMEVEKASCFHAATTAYSSLIYDLKTEMGFAEFISICKTVWDVARVDTQIAEKFVISWLNLLIDDFVFNFFFFCRKMQLATWSG